MIGKPVQGGSSPVVLPASDNLVRMTVPASSIKDLFAETSRFGLLGSDTDLVNMMGEMFDKAVIARDEPEGFESIKELVGIEYVGYIIEKERLNKTTENWIRTDEYRIIGEKANTFIDSRVAYGEVYRYRIKNVARVTKEIKKTSTTVTSDLTDINKLIVQKLTESIQKNSAFFNNSSAFFLGVMNKQSNQNLKVQLFDNFVANITSTTIEVYQDGVVDASDARLEKNSKLTNLEILGRNFNVYLPILDQSITINNIGYKSLYYESLASKNWTYVDIYENVPPPPPESLKVRPNTLSQRVIIEWLKPANDQRDIKQYKIYRRQSVTGSWILLKTLDELSIEGASYPNVNVISRNSANVYIDEAVQVGEKYIYAITSVDLHEIESFLSAQIQVELNPNFLSEKEEKPAKWISGSGARLDETNFVFKKFLNRTEQIIAKKAIKLRPSLIFKETSKEFVIRVTSLDTHQEKEYDLVIYNQKI